MPIITLTTDFGHSDAFVGTMKGVILSICPGAQIVDICHEVPPQDIVAGAILFSDSCRFFPTGTIHVAVVDPGVGTSRAAVAVQTEHFCFVGPDNGLFDLVLQKEKMIRAVKLDNSAFHLQPVSATFHGRDIFAPVAAHLANGVDLQKLGSPIERLNSLSLSRPERKGDTLEIHVLRADRFGNAMTDLRLEEYRAWNPSNGAVVIKAGPKEIHGIRQTFSDVPKNAHVAYFGSGGRLEIAVNGGSAADKLRLTQGSILTLTHA